MSTTAGNPGLRYPVSKLVGAKYRNSFELKSSSSSSSLFSGVGQLSDMPSMSSRSNQLDRTDSRVSQTSRRDGRATIADSDIVAIRDVQYIDSFPVTGDDQSTKTAYVRKYLLDPKNTSRMRPVQLIISLTEVRVYDGSGEVPMMTHALKRIAFATCSPEYQHFSFVAREPKGSTDCQYCHAFLTRSASEAEELNVLVANAFRMAYAHAQSHSPASNRDSMTPPAGNQPVRASSFTVNQPTTPIPISGSPAMTFQDMLRGSLRDSSSSSGLSRSPAHNVGGAQTGLTGGDEELSARLLQISTPNVDQMVLERRHRRNVDQSGTLTIGGGLVEDSTLGHVSTTANSSSPSSREPKIAADLATNYHYPSVVESSSLTCNNDMSSGIGVITRAAVQSANCATAPSSTDLNSAFDTMLMSNLLRTLKIGGGNGDSKPHGSPVMILKELIDFHFVNRAFNEDLQTMERPSFSSSLPPPPSFIGAQQSPIFTPGVSRSDSGGANKKGQQSGASSRSRPLSGFFSSSNGESSSPAVNLNRNAEQENTINIDTSSRLESQRNGELKDDDLSRCVWYQPGLPRETVLDMLIQQDVGAFVVRDSTTHTGCYALSIRVPKYDNEAGISHYLITKTPRGTVRLKGMAKEWNSLTALVTHHTVMRELLPCLLVMPKAMPINGIDRFNRTNSEC